MVTSIIITILAIIGGIVAVGAIIGMLAAVGGIGLILADILIGLAPIIIIVYLIIKLCKKNDKKD